jgi:dipeptidyl aminopeptidase/acylaminoacyl peptidase
MDDARGTDRLIEQWLREDDVSLRASYLAETLERLDRTPQRRLAGSFRRRLGIQRPMLPAVPRGMQLAFVLLLVLVAVVAALLVVGSRPRLPSPTGLAGNGVIAYATEEGLTFVGLDGSRTKTPLHGMGIDSNPAFSPDGTRVAFVSRRLGTEDGQGPEWLFVAPTSGEGPARLLSDTLPVWNLDKDGAGQRLVPDKSHVPPAWSPDGTRIAYTSFDLDPQRVVIAIVPVDGGEPVKVAPADARTDYTHPQWSPDGRWLTARVDSEEFGINWQLVLMRSDGTDPRVVAETPIRTLSFTRVAWSPDGSQLVYDRQDIATRGAYRVVRYDIRTATETAINPPGTRAADAAWSPDGEWIAYHEDSGADTPVRVVIVDGTAARRPRRDLGPVVGCGLAWSPDAEYLLGYANGCEGRLAVVALDDPSRVTTLDAPGARGVVSWQRVAPDRGG